MKTAMSTGVSIANHFVIDCKTNIVDSDGDHSSMSTRFTTSDAAKATSIFEDQCAKHEHVELISYYVEAANRDFPQLIDLQYGGLS